MPTSKGKGKGASNKSSSGGRSSTKSGRGGTPTDSLVASGGREKPAAPQIWKCKVDGLRNFMGKNYSKGETVMVLPSTLDGGTRQELEKYFELTDSASTTITSESVAVHNSEPDPEPELEGVNSDG